MRRSSERRAIPPPGAKDGRGEIVFKSGGGPVTLDGRPIGVAGAARAIAPPPRAPWGGGRWVVFPSAMFRVSDDVRHAAQKMADLASDDLGIPRRPVYWFDEATQARLVDCRAGGAEPERFDEGECLGVYRPERPSAIYVRATDSIRQAVAVAAHETKHRAQHLRRGLARYEAEREACEAEARRYGEQALDWYDCNGGTPWL